MFDMASKLRLGHGVALVIGSAAACSSGDAPAVAPEADAVADVAEETATTTDSMVADSAFEDTLGTDSYVAHESTEVVRATAR